MSKSDKLIDKLLSRSKDFTYNELSVLLGKLGYREVKKGKTAGSRRAFVHEKTNHIIRLHKPHPKNVLKMYQVDYIIKELKKEDLI